MTTAEHPEPSLTVTAAEQDRRLLLPIGEVSELTGVSVSTLKKHAPCERIGTLWLVPRAWLEAITMWPQACTSEAT